MNTLSMDYLERRLEACLIVDMNNDPHIWLSYNIASIYNTEFLSPIRPTVALILRLSIETPATLGKRDVTILVVAHI